MSCIHYKFRNNSKHDTIQFDGSYITVGEIKQAILGQKKMGRAPDFTLQIINAQTQEVYKDDNQLIPRNADVTVKRVPTGTKVSKSQLAAQSTSLDMYKMSNTLSSVTMEKTDLTKSEGTEEDKLKAMMMQQAKAYDNPALNKRFSRADEEIPLNYICHRCGRPGHLIKNCPTNGNPLFELHRPPPVCRKMTLSLKKAEDKKPENVEEKRRMEMSQRDTQDKVKTLAQQAYTNIPQEMKCPLCKQLMIDACLSVCCGQSFCDECIREKILDESACPACGEEVYPDKLISNKALRVTINKYKKDHQDQIAKLYSDCHIKPRSRDSTPKPELEVLRVAPVVAPPKPMPNHAPPPVSIIPTSAPPVSIAPLVGIAPPVGIAPLLSLPRSFPTAIPTMTTLSTKPLIEATSGLALHDLKPALSSMPTPPVAILDVSQPPPAVAILPLKEETVELKKPEEKMEVSQDVKPPVTTILPQIPNYSTPILPLPPVPIMPFNPLLSGPVGILPPGPGSGLLPPPLPLPEIQEAKDDRMLDQSEFFAIQHELRRLQERRRSSRSPPRRKHSSSPPRRKHSSSPPRRKHSDSPPRRKHSNSPPRKESSRTRSRTKHEVKPGKRRQRSANRIRFQPINRTARYPERMGHKVDRNRAVKELQRRIRNDNSERRSHDSDKLSNESDRRSRDSDRRSRDSDPRSRENSDPIQDSLPQSRDSLPPSRDSLPPSRESLPPSREAPSRESEFVHSHEKHRSRDTDPKSKNSDPKENGTEHSPKHKHKKKKDKEHKRKKHKKKDKKEKRKKDKTDSETTLTKPSLTEYSATDQSSDEEPVKKKKARSLTPPLKQKRKGRSSPLVNTILAPRKASPSPDRQASPSPDRKASPSPDRKASPSPDRRSSPSPDRRSSPSPAKEASPSPDRGSSPSPDRGSSPSPDEEAEKRAAKSPPLTPPQATPPDGLPPTQPAPKEASLPPADPAPDTPHSMDVTPAPCSGHVTPAPCSPAVEGTPTLVGTPTATGGVTPQFNGLSTDDEDAVSIKMNVSDREVNGTESADNGAESLSSSSDDEESSDEETSTKLEEMKKQYKEAALQIQHMKEQRAADKKKQKKKKKKRKKAKEEEEERKKKKKKKKKKHKDEVEELEEGEIKPKSSKKRKRSVSERGSQESLEVEVKKKVKKSKHTKKEKAEPVPKSKGVEIKVNFTSLKNINSNSKTISITSPAKNNTRRVQLNVSPIKPLKIKSKISEPDVEPTVVSKPKKNKTHKKSRQKIAKSAVSGIEDDPEYL